MQAMLISLLLLLPGPDFRPRVHGSQSRGTSGVEAQAQAPTRTPDVIYVPTPPEVVEAMLKVANVKAGDVVYDLGCGDGRIVVTAAQKYGARGLASTSIRSASRKPTRTCRRPAWVIRSRSCRPISLRLRISEATVVTLYLLPVAQREADAEVDEGAQARNAHRLARVRHGRLEARADAQRGRAGRCTTGPSRSDNLHGEAQGGWPALPSRAHLTSPGRHESFLTRLCLIPNPESPVPDPQPRVGAKIAVLRWPFLAVDELRRSGEPP